MSHGTGPRGSVARLLCACGSRPLPFFSAVVSGVPSSHAPVVVCASGELTFWKKPNSGEPGCLLMPAGMLTASVMLGASGLPMAPGLNDDAALLTGRVL